MLKYYKSGSCCLLFIDIQNGNFSPWTPYILGVLPVDFRPKITTSKYSISSGGYKGIDAMVYVRTDGSVVFECATAQTIFYVGTIVFPV